MRKNINWCQVCDQNEEGHNLLGCDGETCIYCLRLWDDCNCGIETKTERSANEQNVAAISNIESEGGISKS